MKKKRRYRDFTSFIKKRFGFRVQKVSINAGFTCPNKDGTKGKGGCTYCNNNTLNPNIIIERFFSESPSNMLIFPKYGLKNFEIKTLVEKRLEYRNINQGELFSS